MNWILSATLGKYEKPTLLDAFKKAFPDAFQIKLTF